MTLSYRLTFLDRLAFAAYHLPRNPVILLVSVGFFLLVTFQSVLPAVRELPADTSVFVRVFTFAFVESMLALVLLAAMAGIILLTMLSRKNKTLHCDKTITLGEEAFIGESQYGRSETRWAMVQKLARTRTLILIYLAQESAVLIPRRAFESTEQWDAFYEYCRRKTKRAG
jgi:hypothetical protein